MRCPERSNAEWRENNKERITEYRNEWFKNNEELMTEYRKTYRKINKEQLSKYAKEYRKINKEHITEYITCECGKQFQRCKKARHFKTKYHLNKCINC
jgi:predicted RNA-binding Zn-ribbon protein involved in translation (DUF1610 family)